MSDAPPTLYAAKLRLSRSDVKALKITDAYSLHRVVYSLYDDVRNDAEKRASQASGILYADKGGDFSGREILLLSDRPPNPQAAFGELESKAINPRFLQFDRYAFLVTVNPGKREAQSKTDRLSHVGHKPGKIVPVKGRDAVAAWFVERATQSWGFEVNPDTLQIESLGVQRFSKDGQTVTHGSATLKGQLRVTDRERFIESFRLGIGRGRAFGFGLLQIAPL
jgi:CRISPR system Cascade subunit CasE